MTKSEVTRLLCDAHAKTEWPRIAPRIRWKVKLHGRSRTLFEARQSSGNRVTIIFRVSALRSRRRFTFAVSEACRAANEIARGLTTAHSLHYDDSEDNA